MGECGKCLLLSLKPKSIIKLFPRKYDLGFISIMSIPMWIYAYVYMYGAYVRLGKTIKQYKIEHVASCVVCLGICTTGVWFHHPKNMKRHSTVDTITCSIFRHKKTDFYATIQPKDRITRANQWKWAEKRIKTHLPVYCILN